MKKILTSLCTAAFIAALNVSAVETAEPVFPNFNSNDVNGAVIVEIPENITALVEITFDSPEGIAEPYYSTEIESGSTYTFPIEGRDNTVDDYRTYDLSVTLTGGTYNRTSAPYTETFTIPDGNDDPDSYTELRYVFTIDDILNDNEWDITSDDNGKKEVAVHLNAVSMGDINMDGKITAVDASLVLSEYANLSSDLEGEFTDRQFALADINGNEKIEATDASSILWFYAELSSGNDPSWDDR